MKSKSFVLGALYLDLSALIFVLGYLSIEL